MLIRLVGVCLGFMAVGAPLHAQRPSFDVASIKQNKSGASGGQFGGPPSRFTATNTPARAFITFAYRVQDFLIEGAPDWVKNDRWDINAKAEGTFPATTTIDGPDARREMLRALLVDRFKLSAHKETRERPIYALVLAQPRQPLSSRLHASSVDCAALGAAFRLGQVKTPPVMADDTPDCSINNPPGRIRWGTQTMRQFASILSDTLQRPVVDRTGLEGNFSAVLTYTPDSGRVTSADQPATDPNAASIFTALQEQLGLRLDSTRGPVEILVIDHIERPTED
jgi:uncharacterized protein (TIGR03435 family)